MDNLDTVFDVALPIVVNIVKTEIGRYLEHCYDGLRNVRYKVSYDKHSNAIECLFRWGEFASRHMLSIGDVTDIRLQGVVIEGMMKEVSSGFVKMAVQKQNEVAYAHDCVMVTSVSLYPLLYLEAYPTKGDAD